MAEAISNETVVKRIFLKVQNFNDLFSLFLPVGFGLISGKSLKITH